MHERQVVTRHLEEITFLGMESSLSYSIRSVIFSTMKNKTQQKGFFSQKVLRERWRFF